MIDRRRFLAALVATGGIGAASAVLYDQLRGESSGERRPTFRSATAWRSDKSSADSWTDYFGAVQDQPGWASVQRGGIFADGTGQADIPALRQVLARTALLSWPPPQPSQRTAEGVADFMSLVRATDGAWWRDRVFRYTSGLIEAHSPRREISSSRERRTRNRIIGIHLGNEIDAEDYRQNISTWAKAAGLEYPHPATSFGDDGTYRRDHLGYYVEYFLAPAADGVLAANEQAGSDRIPIVLGSIVGARQPFVRNELLPTLLDYRIEGTYAPALAGRQVKELIDYLSVHYVLTPEAVFGFDDEAERTQTGAWRLLLDEFHDRWVETGVVRGVWHTEEGGAAAQRAHRHASLAVRVFARTMSWAAGRGATADAVKVFAWYKTPADPETGHHLREDTSWAYALDVIDEFIGETTILTDRSAGAVADSSEDVEQYVFETDDNRRRAVVVTPAAGAHEEETVLRTISIGTDGWAAPGSAVDAVGHLFKSDSEGHQRLDVGVWSSADGRRYDLRFAAPVALSAGDELRTLLILLRHT